MKKTRATALMLATVMTLTSVPYNVMADDTTALPETMAPVAAEATEVSESSEAPEVDEPVTSDAALDADVEVNALEGWLSGWTGVADQKKNVTIAPTEDGVRMYTTKANNGKVYKTEDSLAYYAYEIPATADFTISGTVNVDKFNSFADASSKNQATFGMMVLDDLYQKDGEPPKPYVNNVMLCHYMTKSAATAGTIAATHRYNGIRNADADILEGIAPNTLNGTKIGPFEMSITKSGESVKLTVNGESYMYNVEELATKADMPYFADKVYAGFFISRDADVTFSNIQYKVDTRTVDTLELVSMPDKTKYVVDEAMDLTGLQVKATYTDGTSEILEDYSVAGFDSSTMGDKTMLIKKGGKTLEIPYKVEPVMCESLTITSPLVFTEVFIGQRFSTAGFEAESVLNNGTKEVIGADECEFYLDGKKIDEGYYFTEEDLGKKNITVKHAVTETVSASDANTGITLFVEDYTISGIAVGDYPAKLSYAPGDEVDTKGMTVRAIYTNSEGKSKFATLAEDEYELLPVDTSTIGTVVATVSYIKNPAFKDTFNLEVVAKKPVAFQLKHYPRTTYTKGEEFSADGIKAVILYNNDDVEATNDYTIDLSSFDSSVVGVGTSKIVVVPNNTIFEPIEIPVTITEEKTFYWKGTAFGASSTLSSNTSVEGVDENGNKTVTVKSWGGAGKITKDQDGMAYYYTRVNPQNNFTVTADILVNDYLEHSNDDTQRNGQEAFGIMVRDVIPLTPDMDKLSDQEKLDIEAASTNSNYVPMTTQSSKAKLDENGEPMPAMNGSKNYKVTFSSNMALVGGYSGTGWPSDPTAVSYLKNSTINRINLVMRSGVYNADGTNSIIEKHGPFKLSDTFPARGNKYKVTFTKINGGVYASCYDYQTGEEKETYQYAGNNNELEKLFTNQDKDSAYVGFFASRWADITVSNFEVHETNPTTDPITSNLDEKVSSPSIKMVASRYTTNTDYSVSFRIGNPLGGYVTLQQNGKVVYRDEPVSKTTALPVSLNPNSVNKFTVLYKPNKADNLTSYDPIVLNFTITHKDSLGDYDILYCSPDGSINGDGTRENPLDVYSAVGFVDIGKQVVCLEGTYKMTQNFEIPADNTGVAKAWKTLRADDGATVTFDMQKKYEGMTVDGYYWHIKGIDFTNSGDNLKPFLLAGNHCIIEDCKFYNNGDTGFQISRSTDSNATIDTWPEYNVIRDCEAYNNADPAGINADGFGLKLTVGYGNIFERCISHNNLDDGYDAYTKKGSGYIGPVTLDHCVSYDNGSRLLEDGTTKSYNQGGNNGFKMGGESVAVQHYMKDCMAFDNGTNGLTTNSNPALKIRNFVSYNNSGRGVFLYTGDGQRNFNYDVKGVVSYNNGSGDQVDAVDIDVYVKNLINNYNAGKTKKLQMAQVVVDSVSPDVLAEFNAAGGIIIDSGDGNVWPLMVNHSTVSIDNPTNYWGGKNCDGEVVTNDFFKSVDRNDSLTLGKYSQDETGKFILGDFLARTTPYVHEAEDEVVYPAGPQYGVKDDTTETTTAAPTETTTKKPSTGGGSGSSRRPATGDASKKAEGILVTEATTVVESKVEVTTAEAKSFTTPSGVVITPPVASGVKVNFSDINSRPWAVASINKLAQAGIVNGTSADTFSPDAYSKRADFIVMLVKTLGLTGSTTDNFDDVASGKYYANALAIAKSTGVATGYGDGNFGPEKNITRQDMMVLVAKTIEFVGGELDTDTAVLAQFADADAIADYAKPYAAALVNLGLASGTDTGFQPTSLITRAQTAVLVAKLYDTVVAMAEAADVAVEEVTEEVSEETTEATEEVTEEVTEA